MTESREKQFRDAYHRVLFMVEYKGIGYATENVKTDDEKKNLEIIKKLLLS